MPDPDEALPISSHSPSPQLSTDEEEEEKAVDKGKGREEEEEDDGFRIRVPIEGRSDDEDDEAFCKRAEEENLARRVRSRRKRMRNSRCLRTWRKSMRLRKSFPSLKVKVQHLPRSEHMD